MPLLRVYFLSIVSPLTACICLGQAVSVGVVGGIRTTNDLSGGFVATSESKRYVVGPALNIGLPFSLGIEVDALYRREGFRVNGISDERANSWEFPLLIKYNLPFPVIKPFIEAGYAPRWIQGTERTNYVLILPQPLHASGSVFGGTNWPVSQGFVAGGGVQFGIGRLLVAPAVRYTYWNNTPIVGVFSGGGPSWQSTQNQVDILVGIAWKIK